MSLPAKNSAWPPPHLAKVTDRCAESQVWWEGNPTNLSAFYGNTDRTSPTGVVQRAKVAYSAFWGKLPQQATQAPKQLHAPVAGEIANLSARALFSEALTIVAPGGKNTPLKPAQSPAQRADQVVKNPSLVVRNPLQDRIDLIFNTPTFHSALFSGGESCSALGGNYQRVVWDPDTADNAWIDFVDHDHAIPEFTWGRLSAVTFWTELDGSDDRTVYRHFQRYEKGRIVHALYEGTPINVGRPVDLAAHSDTAGIVLDGADDTGTYVELGVDELGAAYVPNVAPNPEWRKDPRLKSLGRADISSDLIPMYHEIDRIYSSLMRDFRIAAARMYASDTVLKSLGRGAGVSLAEEQEVFTSVGSSIGREGSMESIFQFHQPAIRVLEHDQGADMLLREVLRKTGYSPVSMGMSDEVAQTATEASGKKERTVETTQGKARHWAAALAPLVTTCLRVDAVKFPGNGVAPAEEVELEWPPFARETELNKSTTVMNWSTAQAASTRTKVAFLHQDWDDDKIQEEVDLIDSAVAAAVPPSPFEALPDDGAPDGAVPTPPEDDVEEEVAK